ncbi:hypothetical protein L207DRAFT_7404 [Hyaloscypha variabilis F]|jgi:hypothetical protein|uniref:Uncharacterized protein n=1 Tax=Hyaloscypha variabilis (strain UAMH 11265 / GT02V1 / F) TaxID=1149755 RepID=A0A2J6SCF1_HYAVF|nr:hypothetical protein L207DRAFT_7404 [Hyaloscypha variabilis F]
MPRKTAAAAGAAPAPTRGPARVRKPTTPPADTQPTITKSRGKKRKADESDEEANAKKTMLITTQSAPKAATKTNTAAKGKTTSAKTAAKLAKVSTTVTNTTGAKRKASDDEDVEAPQPKKSKTTSTTARPISKATTINRAPKKAAAPKKPAAPKLAAKPPAVSQKFLAQRRSLPSFPIYHITPVANTNMLIRFNPLLRPPQRRLL